MYYDHRGHGSVAKSLGNSLDSSREYDQVRIEEIQCHVDDPPLKAEQKAIVQGIVNDASLDQQRALLEWSKALLSIRHSESTAKIKAKAAVAATAQREVIWPIVQTMLYRLKRLGWDERGWAARLGGGAALAASVVFFGHGAGIAALGTAIGVPLWIVFGAGGAFAGMLLDELERELGKGQDKGSLDIE